MRTIMMVLLGSLVGSSIGACGRESTAPTRSRGQPAPVASASGQPTTAAGPLEITVTEDGFQPARVTVKKGEPITLGFTRKTDRTCAKEVILQVTADQRIEKALPLNERVEISTTFPTSGEVRYACGMDMISGVITVQ